jgi:hypothetical protein
LYTTRGQRRAFSLSFAFNSLVNKNADNRSCQRVNVYVLRMLFTDWHNW